MYDFFKKNFRDYKLVVRYGISGLVGIGSNLTVLYLATDILGIWYMFSAILALTTGFVTAFLLQKYWTFKESSASGMHVQLAKYFVISVASALLDMALLFVFVDVFGLWYFGSQAVVLGFIAFLSFLANKNLTFGRPIDTT